MATVAPPSDQTADLLQSLSLDSQSNESSKKTTFSQYGNLETGNPENGQIQSSERSVTPFLPDLMDPAMCYLTNGYSSPVYYCGSYTGSGNEWESYSRYLNADGVEMAPGVYGDNGPVVYHNSYGYASYGPYSPATSPVPTLGSDGQLYGPQQYQYPYFQPLNPSCGPFVPCQTASSQGELSATATADQKTLPVESAKGNSSGIINSGGVHGNNGSAPYKPTYQNASNNGRVALPGSVPASGYQDPRFSFDEQYKNTGVTSTFSKAYNVPASRNPNFRQNSSFMGMHHLGPMSGMGSTQGFMNRLYPNKLYGQYGNTFRSGMGFGSSGYDSRINSNGWLAMDNKYKTRGQGNGSFGYRNENIDGLNELNRGPRAKSFKNQKGFAPVTLVAKGQNLPPSESNGEGKNEATVIPERGQYNKADFPEDYTDAKFFIIKSYSEDDVHKSIKYNVWASTPNGNKKLDAAYQEAQQKSCGCPIFLFFSVNTSGQFVGLAEMVGPVDFDKNVEYWQQDKWTGCFPVKWHIVKDIPNSLLKHITLENNENKPVTNSRDTQEVRLEQGLKMVKIFKDHSSKTCILDDFGFYEKRQRMIQEKKFKQQQLQKQVLDAKPGDENKELANASPDSLEVVSNVTIEPTSTVQSNGDLKHLENGSAAKNGDGSKASTPVSSEKKTMANGISNGC